MAPALALFVLHRRGAASGRPVSASPATGAAESAARDSPPRRVGAHVVLGLVLALALALLAVAAKAGPLPVDEMLTATIRATTAGGLGGLFSLVSLVGSVAVWNLLVLVAAAVRGGQGGRKRQWRSCWAAAPKVPMRSSKPWCIVPGRSVLPVRW